MWLNCRFNIHNDFPSYSKTSMTLLTFLWNFIKISITAICRSIMKSRYYSVYVYFCISILRVDPFLFRNGKKRHCDISTHKVSIIEETKHDNSVAGQCPVLTGVKWCDLASWLTGYTHLYWYWNDKKKCRKMPTALHFNELLISAVILFFFFSTTSLSWTKLLLLCSRNNDILSAVSRRGTLY